MGYSFLLPALLFPFFLLTLYVGADKILEALRFLVCRSSTKTSQAPRKLTDLGFLPSSEPERSAAMLSIFGPYSHWVRQYGKYAEKGQTVAQSLQYVVSRCLRFPRFFSLLQDGSAHKLGLYWAMFKGDELMQKTLKSVAQLSGAEAQIGCNWSELKDANDMTVWIGPKGHIEQLHYDTNSNLHFQLIGTKTWRCFPPHCSLAAVPCVDICGNHLGGGANFSLVNLERPDFSACPALAKALQQEVRLTIHPGEAVFVPRGWWHQVEAGHDGFTVSANVFEPDSQVPLSFSLTWHSLRMSVAEKVCSFQACVETWFGREPPNAPIAPTRGRQKNRRKARTQLRPHPTAPPINGRFCACSGPASAQPYRSAETCYSWLPLQQESPRSVQQQGRLALQGRQWCWWPWPWP